MVTVLAFAAVAGGAFMLVGGVISTGAAGGDAAGGDAAGGTLAGALPWVTAVVGAAWLFGAWRFWTLQPSGWFLGMGVSAATFLVAVLDSWNRVGPSVIVMLGFGIFAIYCLLSPTVRPAFGADRRRPRR